MWAWSEGRGRGAARHVVLSVSLALGLLHASAPARAVPSFDEVRHDWRASDWILLDRRGEPLQRLRADMQAQRGDWVTLADVSPEHLKFYCYNGLGAEVKLPVPGDSKSRP